MLTVLQEVTLVHSAVASKIVRNYILNLPIKVNSIRSMNNGVTSIIETAKERAAALCVDDNVLSGHVIGVGSGSTALYSIQRLADIYHSGKVDHIKCVPTSYDSRHLLHKHSLPVCDLDQYPLIDVYIDGADEIDRNLDCIKGGGGCLTEEKIVMSCSKKFLLIADFRKKVQELGQYWQYIPIEVCRNAHVPVARRIESTEGGTCKLRTGSGKAGPLITDNGNFILDWYYVRKDGLYSQWNLVNARLTLIPGVVETGLFIGAADKAYIGQEDGTVYQLEAPEDRPEEFKKAIFSDKKST